MLSRLGSPYYGWYVVAIAFISLSISQGASGVVFGIFLPAMSAELGWSQSTIVVASSIAYIMSAAVGPPLGRIADRSGPRTILIISILLLVIGMAGCGLVREPWQFYITFGLLTGVARFGLQSLAPGTMISNWFVRKRAAAYGAAAMGPPVATFIMPPIIAYIVESSGWQAGWFALAVQAIVIGLVPTVLVRHQKPEEIGLQPDGVRGEAVSPSSTNRTSQHHAIRGDEWTAAEAVRSPAFWMVASGMSLVLLGPQVAIVFMFSHFVNLGSSPTTAALALSVVSGVQALSRLAFWAPVSTRIHSVRWLLVIWGVLMFGGTLCLAFAQDEVWGFAATVVLGVALGGNLVLQLQVWPEYFGRTALGTIIGIGSTVGGVTWAIVPLVLAVLLDYTGDYRLLYVITSSLILAGLSLHVLVGKPRRPARRPVGA